jgi:SAM-dependent methyltransferase
LTELEDRHWWYAERRTVLRKLTRGERPRGWAVDVGAAGGGNTRVLLRSGWSSLAVEYSEEGAAIARARGLPTVRGDATALPIASEIAGLVVAFDVIEHVADDLGALREMCRVLMPGGLLAVAVPADPRLWSAHDDAVHHLRRYTRDGLVNVVGAAGLQVESVRSWNVLLRPLVRLRRRSAEGSDLRDVQPVANGTLRAVVSMERVLPLGRLPGVSLVLTARRRQD